MAEEGKNKVASSLLDLQPTAVLDFYKIYPDRVNIPTLFIGFHGGALFDKSVIWQGIQYLPLAIEAEGFDILGDGTLARPKIRVANENAIVTNLLQNHNDLVNAQVIRKRVFVRYLDDVNFDGGNPFGSADSKAEISEDIWVMGRKTQESKIFVEFELNSPLDLENFNVNYRSVVAKHCPWQYRGEGCRYAGWPIERENAEPFTDTDGNAVIPNYEKPSTSPVDFFYDPTAEWTVGRAYEKGNIVVVKSPLITLPPVDRVVTKELEAAFKTVYVCVSGNTNQNPYDNPTYWQKDGCCKKLSACQKRFKKGNATVFRQSQNVTKTWNSVGFSGYYDGDVGTSATDGTPQNTGLFHSHDPSLTGHFTGAWTIMGWTKINDSMNGAGILSTTQSSRRVMASPETDVRDFDFININFKGNNDGISNATEPRHGWGINWHRQQEEGDFPYDQTNVLMSAALAEGHATLPSDGWKFIVISHSLNNTTFGNEELFPLEENSSQTSLAIFTNETWDTQAPKNLIGPTNDDWIIPDDDVAKAFVGDPHKITTFMLGAAQFNSSHTWPIPDASYSARTIDGELGPWAIWNRILSYEEISHLYKAIAEPYNDDTNSTVVAPRNYADLTGNYSAITGNGLVAWWDASTGIIPSTSSTGMLDIHTGSLHLTGSGGFSGVSNTYKEAPIVTITNTTPEIPRFGGFPGTDGFSYGRDTQY
tara:strand:- start:9370 stop:11484 length:2115 start_codon:yes stop_codon:yes gene_type:complete